MFFPALRRAHGQLQGHRTWLSTFVSCGRISGQDLHQHATNITRHTCDHSVWQWNVRHFSATAGAASKGSTLLWLKRKQQQKNRLRVAAPIEDADQEFVNDFQQAISDVDVKQVIKLFPEAQKRRVLHHSLLWRTVQCMHEGLRRHARSGEDEARREAIEEIVGFTERMCNTIRKGELEPDRRGHLRLIAIFKESGAHAQGIAFWQWLEEQDEQYVGLDVYGSAIELLAASGTPLPDLEQLYERALQRFPESFNAYHLSPDAVVPDRNQATEIKGISMTLLQGILTARLLRGESRRAYLALDTALRLYPALTPPRFFALFIKERPLAEAYTVFALACRAGVVLPLDTARQLLTALRNSADMRSHESHVAALRQMLSAVYMYVGAGGSITSNVVNEIVIAITQTLRLELVAGLDAEQKKQLVGTTLDAIRKILETFAHYGASPGISAFNSIIVNLGGYGHSEQTIKVALRDAQALGVQANHVTRRSILTAAGMLGNKDQVIQAWQDLVSTLRQQDKRPDVTDHNLLVRAARTSGCVNFAQEACQAAIGHLPEHMLQSAIDRLHDRVEENGASGRVDMAQVSSLMSMMEQLRKDLDVLGERTLDHSATQDLAEQRLPMIITSPAAQQTLPEHEQRALYDELTTEQAPAKPASLPAESAEAPSDALTSDVATPDALTAHASFEALTKSPAVSTTGIPLGILRYENWKTINYLLALAEQHDNTYNRVVDEAISAGRAPPPRDKVLRDSSKRGEVYYGLSDMGRTMVVDEGTGTTAEQIGEGRSEVLRIRGRLA
ncbi:hypothetical protein B0A54_11260 [Friedmanniomyces endolithicus]|uniref:Pentacotripeptide-repeat region of PRORP domain-containing protein n=1 Tax=Friedmanniomyces endolithicus TaxID=329885 RepID=A0A4U0UQN2_9PEZI|nr:hypothetical protein LTS09_009842 [Friedmanniomyces endolithicus]TKA37275.1 hypothetical protein B0A54_11260 [Friedmanniomyces endolithicus]